MSFHSEDVLTQQSRSASSTVPQGKDFWPFGLFIPTFLQCVRYYFFQPAVYQVSGHMSLTDCQLEDHMRVLIILWYKLKKKNAILARTSKTGLCAKACPKSCTEVIEQMINL